MCSLETNLRPVVRQRKEKEYLHGAVSTEKASIGEESCSPRVFFGSHIPK